MKTATSTAVVIALCMVIVNLGGIYAPNVTPGPGFVYIAAERNTNNNGDTGYFKVGGAALNVHQNRKRTKLNTGNPRRLVMRYYVPVSQTRAAEAAALNALQQWAANLGGGREWFYVIPNEWNNFLAAFQGTIQQYRMSTDQLRQLYNNRFQRRNTSPLQRNQYRNLNSPYRRRSNRY